MKKKIKKWGSNLADEIVHLWPCALFFVLLTFVRKEIFILFLSLLTIFAVFAIRRYKNEIAFFIVGALIGFAVEMIGDHGYKLQYWIEGSLFGIPLWLPVFWGIAFVAIRRIGNAIVED